ncbi:peptidase inhibitor family I36 protein [Streptosporangiaceae bacterium NEAU-GS5]|nr:peptidase inhibitor family I36 protein [Streptosporangiaceae bacterium NEAU-GS5]
MNRLGNHSKWIKAALSSFALTALAFATTPPPAGASTAALPTQCPFTQTICLYDGPGFTGARFTLTGSNTCVDLVSHGWGGGRAKSAINTRSTVVVLWASTGCASGGPFQYIFPNEFRSPLGLSANSVQLQ